MEKEQKHKNKGLIATIGYHAVLVLAFVFFGLSYQDPPPEEGIAINFGYEDDGFGNTSQSAEEQSAPQPEEVVEEEIENVATQDLVDAPSITEEKPKVKPNVKPTEKPVDTKPQPSERLKNLTGKVGSESDAGTGSGEGITQGGGDQGRTDGDINSQNRTGGGSGNGNYRLAGRTASHKETAKKDCINEAGRVIVRVHVNREGKTVGADVGVNIPNGEKTNSPSTCLWAAAKKAALKTTWQSDPKAPETQFGYIIYNFTDK